MTYIDFEQKIKQEREAYIEKLGLLPQDNEYTLMVFAYRGAVATGSHSWFFRTLCYDAPLECCLGFMREHAKLDTDDEGGVYIIMQGDRRVYTHYVDPDMYGDLAVEPYCYDAEAQADLNQADRMLGFEDTKGEELEGIIGDGGFCSDYELEIIKGFAR